jgi:uncharacterized protein (TIGR03663 family)
VTAREPLGAMLTKPLGSFIRAPRETIAWLALLGVAMVSRFVDLDARAMSHDESLHAFYSFQLFNTGVYRHDPAYHGPLLYHANALVYWLVGASDGSARLLPALAGIGVIMALYLFRPYLGRTGAWLAAALMAVSPTLLFYSRFLWSDIYVAVLSLVWIYCAFRYLADPRFPWLVGVTVAMALGFLTKEVSFIFGAIIGTFFASLCAIRAPQEDSRGLARGAGDLAVLMLSLALPFTAAVGHLAVGWDPTDDQSRRGLLRSAALVGILAVLGAGLAWAWFRPRADDATSTPRPRFGDWIRLALVFWVLQILFFTTFLTNLPRGLASGVVGSLGYWLGEHETARGGQPWFYYLLLGALYEFLPLSLGVLGLGSVCRRLWAHRWDGPDERDFLTFCAWWAAASWMAYAWAGEKMPWLLTNLVVPLCLLGGWWTGRVLEAIHWRALGWPAAVAIVGATPALVWVGIGLARLRPFAGGDLGAVAATMRWVVEALAAVLLGLLAAKGIRAAGWAQGRRLALVGLVGLAALFTVRSAVRLAYVNYDLATELLVYAHGTPDIKAAMAEIKLISERTSGGNAVEVAYDDASTWPLAWYLRDYPNTRLYGSTPTPSAMAAPIIIVGPKNAEKVWPFVARGYIKRDYRLIWWPIQEYRSAGWRDLARAVWDPATRERLWQFVLHRRLTGVALEEWPNRHGFAMHISRDLAQQVWSVAPPPADVSVASSAPIPTLAGRIARIYDDAYEGARLRAPTALAVAPDGARVIADSGNDRVVILNRDGSFRLAFGTGCRLTQQPPAGCRDPDGAGPRELGDGQFHELWGVAVNAAGEIYVADTWNGRIQVFDAGGHFLRRWGRFGQLTSASPAVDPLLLYGPRGLALDGEGNLLVADTGNKRILRFSPTGEPLQQMGGPGRTPGRFSEPVGVAVGATDPRVYVADAWNRRVQALDRRLEPVAQWAVPGWEGRGPLDKPYLASALGGLVYASDPERARILIFDSAGHLDAALALPAAAAGTASRPVGLAVDPTTESLLVADNQNNRILVLPLAR